jgi:hypothetical protein
MANRYWVGGTGTWDGVALLKWALTSGGVGGQAVPTSSDTVFFDANSGANTVTLGANANCSTLTMTGFTGTLAFSTFNISLAGTGTIFTQSTTMSVTGTPVINITSSGSTAITISVTSVTEANAISFNLTGGTYSFAHTNIAGIKNLDFTGFAGSWANNSGNIFGNLTISTGMTVTAGTSNRAFAGTSGTQLITTNGKTLDFPIFFGSGTGTATYQLQDAMTVGSTRTAQLSNGTLDLNNKSLTCGLFSSSNSITRTLAFGTGQIYLTGNNTTIFTTATFTGLTLTGTPILNATYSGATGTRTITTGNDTTGAIAFSANISAGTDIVSLSTAARYINVNFTGFSGSCSVIATNIYGNLTCSSTMTFGSNASQIAFVGTSGTQQITCAGTTWDFPVTFNGVGGTFQLQDAMTVGSTRAVTLTNGTLDLNSKNLTCGLFTGSNTNTRTLAFGTGQIYVTSTAGGAIWSTGTSTNFTVTGTPIVNITNSTSTATSVGPGTLNEANSISFNFTAGTYTLTFLGTASHTARNVDFTGFAGTWAATSTSNVIYGNLTLSTGITLSSSANTLTFGATSGTQAITTNGKTLDFPITFNGVGGTFQLQDAMTVGSTRTVTLTNGTLDMNSKNLTCGLFSSSNTNTRTLAFGIGQMYLTGSSTIILLSTTITNYTITGTPIVNCTYSGSVGTRQFAPGIITEANNSYSINVTAGSDSFLLQNNLKNVDFTGFSGTMTGGSTSAHTAYGNYTLSSTMTVANATATTTFAAASATQTFTSNGVVFDRSTIVSGTTNTVLLADALTLGSTQTFTLTSGTLNMNSKNLTCGIFSSNNSNTRTLAFGAGQIYVTGNNSTVWNTATATSFSYTGTSAVNFTYSGATGTRTIAQAGSGLGGTEANCLNMNISAGSDTVTFGGAYRIYRNLDFTGFTGTYTNTNIKLVGNLTFSTGMTLSSGSNVVIFSSTSGTKTITTNSQILDFPIQIDGAGGTFQFQDALTQGSTQALTITNGTVQLKNGATSTVGSLATSGSNQKYLQSSVSGSAAVLSQASGTVNAQYMTIKDSSATGGAVFNSYQNNQTGSYTSFNNIDNGNNTGWFFNIPNLGLLAFFE